MRSKSRARPARDRTGGGFAVPRALIVAWVSVTAALVAGGVALQFTAEEATRAWEEGVPKVEAKVAASATMPTPTPAPGKAPAPESGGKHAPEPGHGAGSAPADDHPAPAGKSAPPPAAPPPAPPEVQPVAPDPEDATPLAPAPAPGLVEESRSGPLPKIGPDGRGPFQIYARPFPAGVKKPRIAIALAEMGVSGVTTNAAMDKLPAAIDFAFAPHADRIDAWIERARSSGHEVLLSLAMEPIDYPRTDPGPNALHTLLKPERNIERLRAQLGKAVGYVGVVTTSGGKFLTDAKSLRPVLDELRARGLLFLDPHLTPEGVGTATSREARAITGTVDRVIDGDPSRGAIDDQLAGLESDAKARGSAIGLGLPYPSTIERLLTWAVGLSDRGFILVPVSAAVPFNERSDMPAPPAADAPAGHETPPAAGHEATPAAGGHEAPPAAKKAH